MLLIELNDISLAKTSQRSFNKLVKPGKRGFPALVLVIPLRLVSPVPANPVEVIGCVGNTQKHRMRAILAVNNWNGLLAPYFA